MEVFAEQVGTVGLFAVFLCLDEPVAYQYHPGGTGTEPDTVVNAHEHPRREGRERSTTERGDGDKESTQVPTASGGPLLAASSLVLNHGSTIAPSCGREKLHHPRGAAHREKRGDGDCFEINDHQHT